MAELREIASDIRRPVEFKQLELNNVVTRFNFKLGRCTKGSCAQRNLGRPFACKGLPNSASIGAPESHDECARCNGLYPQHFELE